MKRAIFLLVGCLSVLSSVAQNMIVFDQFHQYYDQGDWAKLGSVLHEDFELIDWNHRTVANKKRYLEQLQNWNAVLGTRWQVISAEERSGKVYATEQDSDMVLMSMYPTLPMYSFVYELEGKQIRRITYDTLPGNGWLERKMEKTLGGFLNWSERYYPREAANLVGSDLRLSARAFQKLIPLYRRQEEKQRK